MAVKEALEFLEYAQSDPDLDKKVDQVISSDAGKIDKYSKIIPIAKEKGYQFTVCEFEEALFMSQSDLDEDEFLSVAGGSDDPKDDPKFECSGIGLAMQ